MRCAYCHGDAREVEACARCGALLHPQCRLDLGGCTSLGCASATFRREGSKRDAPGPPWPLHPAWPLLGIVVAAVGLRLASRIDDVGLLSSLCAFALAASIVTTLGATALRLLERLSRWLSVGWD